MAVPIYISNDPDDREVFIDNKATKEVVIVGYNFPGSTGVRIVGRTYHGVIPVKIVGIKEIVNSETLS